MAAAAASTKKQLNEIVECSICYGVYNDPRTLPCIHSYCYTCIADWCKDKQPGDKVACPQCRQEFSVPQGGVSDLPKNFFIGNLLKTNEFTSEENKVKLCDSCSANEDQHSDKTAEVFCFECQQNLCKTCKKYHSQLRSCNNHTVVDISELSGDDAVFAKYSSTFCDKHKNKPIEIYCFDCKTTLCMMCYIKDHNAHKCSDITEVGVEFRETLTQEVQVVMTSINKYDLKLDTLHSRRTSFLEQVNKVETEISNRAEALKALIDDEKQKLFAEVHEIKTKYEKELSNAAHEITQNKSLLESLKKYCDELLKKGTACDISRQVDSLRKRMEDLGKAGSVDDVVEKTNRFDVSLLPSNVKYDKSYSFLGQVIDEGAKPGTPTLARTLIDEGVTAAALLDDELFVSVAGVAQSVSVYDTIHFQLQRQLTVPGLFISGDCNGMAVCSNNRHLFVSDYNNSCVHRVDLSTNAANNVTKWTVVDKPRGISLNSARNVLVAMWDAQKVLEYTPTGTFVREISCNNGHIWQAVELNNGIWALGQYTHGVTTVSMDGRVINSYRIQSAGNVFNPRCLTVSKFGSIVITDLANHKIHVVNSSLTDSRQLPLPVDEALKSPHAIILDESRGRLYVGESGGRLLLFENVTNISAMFRN